MTHPHSVPSSAASSTSPDTRLRLRQVYASKQLLVIGGTGFLGKVWWSLLLDRLPDIDKVFLVVRARGSISSEARFWSEIAPHECLAPLRKRYGDKYEAFLRSKLVPIEGDITQPYCGLSASLRDRLRDRIDAVVNASGIVNFQPPLDIALEVNAFGAQTVVDLAKDLGNVPVMHTSTCYVAGYRTGIVEETDPLVYPFPFAGKLEQAHWDPDREIAECLDIITQAKHRAGDAFRQSHFLDQAKRNLLERGEPSSGTVLDDEIAKVRRRFVELQLSQLGQERAQFWGWPNTYTYTKSIGEQIIARSGLPFTIVRPAIIESCVDYPCPGWNEGVNTSAPIIYAIRQGQTQLPGDSVRLDLIPCDFVASGMILSLAELLEGRAKPVYQYGTSDSNPVTMSRVYELSGLYKRHYYLRTRRAGPVVNFIQAHVEGALMRPKSFERYGPKRVADTARGAADLLAKLPSGGVSLMLEPVVAGLRQFARGQERVAAVVGQFVPFTAELDYEFRCDNTRTALGRVEADEKELLYWQPEQLDWRDWFLNTHVPGLERHVFPELEAKLRKPVKPLHRHDNLVHLLREMATRFEHAVALQHVQDAGLTRVTFADWHRLAEACARRLQQSGVAPGDAVAVVADHNPDWAVAVFGIVYAGAVAVPVPVHRGVATIQALLSSAEPKFVLVDQSTRQRWQELDERPLLDLEALTQALQPSAEGPGLPPVNAAMPALVLHTHGHGGRPRPVTLTHEQLTSALSVLAPLLKLNASDRLLGVPETHSWFQLVCGLLLPLSRGATVVYPRSTASVDVLDALRAARITAIVGNPTVWKGLTESTSASSRSINPISRRLTNAGRVLSAKLDSTLGIAAAPVLLPSQHQSLGGHLRLLINGDSSIAPTVSQKLGEFGLPLLQVYSLAEVGVVSVSAARTHHRNGQLGLGLPGITLRIHEPDLTGLGEIVVRSVATGTGETVEVHTGDLGRLDDRGRLTLLGRRTAAWRTRDGRWLHPLDIEQSVGALRSGSEWAAVITKDANGAGRLACVGVAFDNGAENAPFGAAIRAELSERFGAFPRECRPAYVLVRKEALPRVESGHVDREALERQLVTDRFTFSRDAGAEDANVRAAVRRALQEVMKTTSELSNDTSLRVDMPMDALQGLRFVEALERIVQRPLHHAQWLQCDTVGDTIAWLSRSKSTAVYKRTKLSALSTTSPLQTAARSMTRKVRRLRQLTQRISSSGPIADTLPLTPRLMLLASGPEMMTEMTSVRRALGQRGHSLVVVVPSILCVRFGPTLSTIRSNSYVTYSGLRELIELTGTLLEHDRVPLVLTHASHFDDCACGLGRLVLETNAGAVPIALSVSGRKRRAKTVMVGHCITAQELRDHFKQDDLVDAERSAAAVINQAIAELHGGRALQVSELVQYEPASHSSAAQGARAAERANPARTQAQDAWSAT